METKKAVTTRGSAWLQKLQAHRHPDFAKRPKIWCKVVSRVQDLDISHRSGHAWNVPFMDVDKTVYLEPRMFMMVARAHPTRTHLGKPAYDIKLIACDGKQTYVVSREQMVEAVHTLHENKHIDMKQVEAARSNEMYLCALYAYSQMEPTSDQRYNPATADSPLKQMASRKSTRRVTRIAAIEEEINATDDEFQP